MITTESNLDRFDIRNFTERLTPAKGKNRYICPVCSGQNFTIDPKDGAYKCWSGECESKDIREAVSPWDDKARDKNARDRINKPKLPTPALIPDEAIQLAKLPSPVTHPEKRKRGHQTEIEYPYSDTQWVLRIERPSYENPKGYEKAIYPYHLSESGEPRKGKGDTAWNPYRIDEVKAHGTGLWTLGVEGEPCVESVRFLELIGFTSQGSSWSDGELTRAALMLKTAGVAGVAYLPDHDKTGYEKAKKMADAAAKAQLPFVQLDLLALWPECPDKGDVADWVKWGMEQGWDKDEFIRRLEEQLNAAADKIRQTPIPIGDPPKITTKERLRLDIKALLQETDSLDYEVARADIQSRYRLKDKSLDRIIRDISRQTKEAEVLDLGLDELFDMSTRNLEYVIPGMLPVGETALLIATPKAGKSLLAYDAAFAVATGEDTFLGERCKQGKVLIVQCDESIGTAKERLLKRGFRREDAPNVRFMQKFKITQLAALEIKLETFRPTLVIIDSLRKINAGREVSENSAEFADNIYQLKELCSQYNAALILIHHSNKNTDAVGVEKVRGSSAIAGAAWGVWELAQIPKPDPNNKKKLIIDPKDPARILSIIARDVEGERLRIELDPENNHWLNQGREGASKEDAKEQKSHAASVLDLLKSVAPVGLEASEINGKLGIGRGIYSILNRLLGQKIIGSRPSEKDRRRTVYFCSLHEDLLSIAPQKLGNPPPPTDTVSNVIEYAESIDIHSVQSSITFDHKSITFDHITPAPAEEKQPSNQELVSDTTGLITFTPMGGGEGSDGLSAQTVTPILMDAIVAPSTSSENSSEGTVLAAVEDVGNVTDVAPCTSPLPQKSLIDVLESTEPEDLSNGSAVGRMARIQLLRKDITIEIRRVVRWCERNGFYILENGEFAYPYELILVD
jgi:hypothetical protein